MGSRWAKIIAEHPRTELSAIVDSDVNVAEGLARQYQTTYHTNQKITLADSGIDAVLVAVPHKFLYPCVKRGLQAGKHVLVEKPGSRTAQEMEALITLARQKRRSLMVGFNYRFFEAVRRAKQAVQKKQIGEINIMRIRHGHAGRPGYDREWRMNKAMAGGGVLMDLGVHNIDLALWFLGEPVTEVRSLMNGLLWKASVEENAFLLLKSAGDKIASLHVSVAEWNPIFCLEIIGSRGYCRVDGVGRKYGGSEVFTLGKVGKTGRVTEKKVVCNPDPDNSLRLTLGEFIAALEARREPRPGAQDALAVLRVAEAAYRRS